MDDRMTPMEAEVLEMTVPACSEPQDSYGTAPRPKRKRSYVGLWIGIGLVVIGLCTFSAVATMFEVSLVRNEDGKLVLSMERPSGQTVNPNPVKDLIIPAEGETGAAVPDRMIGGAEGVSLPASDGGNELSAAELYRLVSPGVVCLELDSFYGTQYATGIVISSDGYILTAIGTGAEANTVTAVFSDSGTAAASRIGEDPVTGVCLYKANANGLTPLTFEQDPDYEVGAQIYCIGNPHGTTMSHVLYAGMLSGVDSVPLDGSTFTLLDTSTDLQSAGYGSPIFNTRGHVIGISSPIGTRLFSGDDPCFGISSADLSRIMDGFSEQRSGAGLWLGFEVESIPLQYQYLFNYPDGIWISDVARGTRVYGVLQPYDIILSVNGLNVRTPADFSTALEESEDGYALIILYRSGKKYFAEVPVLSR